MPAQPAFALVVAVLVAANLLNNRVAPAAYPVTGVITAAILVVIAHAAGLGWRGLGLGRGTAGPGLRWALLAFGIVAVCYAGLYALGAALPWTRGFLLDQRVVGAGPGQVAYQVLLRIPLGTVLLEEVAFRGVLYGLLLRERGAVTATVGSSVLFGLWHVLPALALLPSHPMLRDRLVGAGGFGPVVVVAVVVGAVLATALGGAVFCELRRLSGSLLAPIGLHYAFNGLGFLAAALVTARH
ncbi:MAG: lysostaphin resistance A-like protein [Streptomycetales bacterium]